jgi:hypothetical protein
VGKVTFSPAVHTVYCARAVEPFLSSIFTRSGCLTRLNACRKHAQLAWGQLPYRPPPEDALSERKVFPAKGLVLRVRKDFHAGKQVWICRLCRPPAGNCHTPHALEIGKLFPPCQVDSCGNGKARG